MRITIDPFFPPPAIDPEKELYPLERIRVYDGLIIDARKWRKAHEYSRQRQNIYYQSLHQPGIVYGLGICQISPPKEVSAKYRAFTWVRVRPGVAIDWEGNLILVAKPVDFPLNPPQTLTKEPVTVYLVIGYRDPEALTQTNTSETLAETFRLDQKTSPPARGEVELCRISWQQGITRIEAPQNVLFPQINELDLTRRSRAKDRAEVVSSIGAIEGVSTRTREYLSSLMTSISALYPPFKGVEEVGSVLPRSLEVLARYTLFYLSGPDLKNLTEKELAILSQYLKIGGVILIETSAEHESIEDLSDSIAQKFNLDSSVWQKSLSREHPLRRTPFLFATLPEINRYPIELWHDGGGIILIEGELSAAWGFDEELFLSRQEIRTAQEFGVNLLHFAWQRRHLTDLIG